jgi:hypothetical protein
MQQAGIFDNPPSDDPPIRELMLAGYVALRMRAEKMIDRVAQSRVQDWWTGNPSVAEVKDARLGKIKMKKKHPWGGMQIRDAWSKDAMSYRETESMGKRLESKYRYHPLAWQRRATIDAVKYASLVSIFCLDGVLRCTTNHGIFSSDYGHILQVLRSSDISPRSRRYPFPIETFDLMPPHIEEYRRKKREKMLREERIAKLLFERLGGYDGTEGRRFHATC